MNNEQICLSILKNLKLANGRMMRQEILFRIVSLELAYMKPLPTEIHAAFNELETSGKIAADRGDFGVIRYVLTEEGRALLLAQGM